VADHVVRWTMTATHAEVLRVLPPELLAAAAVEGRYVRGGPESRRWELELLRAPALRIGLLHLEVTELVIRLWDHSEDERARFLQRLEQCTRRGGG
jgi:hypothetical protein